MKSKGRGVESPKNFEDLMEETLNRLESPLRHQEWKWREYEGVRIRRGMNPLYIP
jgi:hypothetical protein